jgi:hypothetical protein
LLSLVLAWTVVFLFTPPAVLGWQVHHTILDLLVEMESH